MNNLKRILLVEDDPKDVELTLTGLKELGVFWAVINEPPPGSLKKS
jgi:hypothetical protein